MFQLSSSTIEPSLSYVSSKSSGALVNFSGTVRNHNAGKKVKSLYYEVYYKDRLLGRSAGYSDFVIRKKGEETRFDQSVDLVINKYNIEVATNYLAKTSTDFTAMLMANVMGVNISLKKIKFTY